MFIGLLKLELRLSGCSSLKQKRQTLNAIKDRFGKHKNVAVTESNFNDVHQRAELSFICMSNDKSLIEAMLAKISHFCGCEVDAQIVNEYVEWL
ncbi:hypothetical protein TDB9533_01278 [Thalassocella blandensis]|nr:hypothetical protein TDB9533_01278 [Thalassocella blandensis]